MALTLQWAFSDSNRCVKYEFAMHKVRAEESRQMKADGLEPLLTHSRFILLKRPENLTDKQEVKLADLLQYNL